MLEGDGKAGLGSQPTVGDDGDVVVGRDGLEHGNGEGGDIGRMVAEVVEEDDLAVDVLDEDPEGLARSVDLFIPSEVGNNSQIDAKEGVDDWLDLR